MAWLLQNTWKEVGARNPISHVNLVEVWVIAMYSIFALDCTITICFLLFHVTIFFFMNNNFLKKKGEVLVHEKYIREATTLKVSEI